MSSSKKVFEVLTKSDRDDSTETLFAGSWRACCIYLQAYIDAIVALTDYKYLTEGDAKIPTEYDVVLMFRSPLVSQPDFFLWIDQAA